MWFVVCSLLLGIVAADAPFKVDTRTQMFVDTEGRTRMFHGLNIDYKWLWKVDVTDEMLADYAIRYGFNVIRVAIEWWMIEPEKGSYNSTLIAEVREFTDKLAKHNLYYFLDMHQDTWSPALCGNGAPEWATILTAKEWASYPSPAGPACKLNDMGHPDCSKCDPLPFNWWGAAYFSVADNAAFGSLYNNAQGIQDAWAAMWAHVVRAFKDSPNLVGYELLNEPWMGDIYKDPRVLVEAGYSDRKYLQPMYKKAHEAIRAVDNDRWIMYEPTTRDTQVFPFGAGFTEGPGGAAYNDRQVFAWHHYCPLSSSPPNGTIRNLCDRDFARDSFKVHTGDGKRLGGGMFLTEFGAIDTNHNGFHELDYVCDLADAYLQSWTYWDMHSLFNSTGITIHLGRPYPLATAGVLHGFSFNNVTRSFQMEYETSTTNAVTEIFMGSDLHYKGNPVIAISPHGAVKQSLSPNKQRLLLVSASETAVKVTIAIDPQE